MQKRSVIRHTVFRERTVIKEDIRPVQSDQIQFFVFSNDLFQICRKLFIDFSSEPVVCVRSRHIGISLLFSPAGSDIQLDLHFLFHFCAEVLHLDRTDLRQIVGGIDAEVPQEFFGRAEHNRAARRVEAAKLLHQIVLHQFVDRVIALDAADLVDLLLRDRLLVAMIERVSIMTSVRTAFFGCMAMLTR